MLLSIGYCSFVLKLALYLVACHVGLWHMSYFLRHMEQMCSVTSPPELVSLVLPLWTMIHLISPFACMLGSTRSGMNLAGSARSGINMAGSVRSGMNMDMMALRCAAGNLQLFVWRGEPQWRLNVAVGIIDLFVTH